MAAEFRAQIHMISSLNNSQNRPETFIHTSFHRIQYVASGIPYPRQKPADSAASWTLSYSAHSTPDDYAACRPARRYDPS